MLFTEISVVLAIILISSSVLALYLSAYALFRKQVSGAIEFSCFMLTVALYSIGYAFEINATSLEQIIDFIRFQFLWTSFTAPLFLLFVIRFVKQKPPENYHLLLLLPIPVIIAVLGLTIDSHQLLYLNYTLIEGEYFSLIKYEGGPWYVVQQVFLIGTSFIAELILLIHVFKTKGAVQKQTILILFAGVLPTVNAILQPERSAYSNIDYQPFVMLIMGVLLSVALFKFHMLDLVSTARWMAVDSIHDYLVILDKNRIIQDINNAGKANELLSNLKIGSPFSGTSEFASFIEAEKIFDDINGQKRVHRFEWNNKSYQFTVSQVSNKKGETKGFVILVNENTEVTNLLKELKTQAIHDELTGMFNRRQLINLADREIDIAKRAGSYIGIIILDVDHFKNVNDSFGHLAGDKVLKEIASCIKDILRPSEISGRYGGEEFCIICPKSNGDESLAIAERLRASIAELIINIDTKQINVTASFGVHSASAASVNETEELLKYADLALYRAKANGRNQSVLWKQL